MIIQYAKQAQIGIQKILSEATQPIGREGGGGSAQRGRSLISTFALLELVQFS